MSASQIAAQNQAPANIPSHSEALRKQIVKMALYAALALLAIPGVTYWFAAHVENHYVAEIRADALRWLDSESGYTGAELETTRLQFTELTVPLLCSGNSAELATLKADLCGPTQHFGQFEIARQAARLILLLGLFTLGGIAALAWTVYQKPQLQYPAFTLGWWSLRFVGALEVVAQGAMLVWLSYWLTAYFANVYVVKLILLAAVLALLGVWVALAAIFKRSVLRNEVSGELITQATAPMLWARIQQFAQLLKTEPPKQVIAGIDDNFFVTQMPIHLPNVGMLEGRSLYVSLPLLRVMSWDEADAVLAHELAHFSGGDTQFSAALGPKLAQFEQYSLSMLEGGLTLILLFPLNFFRAAFEFGFSKNSREREFQADTMAAKATSPAAIARSLVKISGYSSYRAQIQSELFANEAKHDGALNIPDRLASGLSGFTATPQFSDAMQDAAVPHPFDSHPPMRERMQNVGAAIALADYPGIVLAPPQQSWVQLIPEASAIEQRLWSEFEKSFADEHEHSLAFRYLPSNEVEQNLVLKYFPNVSVPCKKGLVLRISYQGIVAPNAEVSWDQIKTMQYNNATTFSSDSIVITTPEKNAVGLAKSITLKFAIDTKDRERVQALIGQYWHRHQTMRTIHPLP